MMKKTNLLLVLGLVTLFVGLASLIVVCALYYARETAQTEYGVVMDAGSSHTSLFVYNWTAAKLEGTGEVQQMTSCRIEDSISSFAENPSGAGESLKDCLQKAKDTVPFIQQPFTPVYLGATAGMRLLELKNINQSRAVIDSVRKVIADSGFQVNDINQQVRIIDGEEEGVGVWITTNYITGALENKSIVKRPWWEVLAEGTTGIMDMGGASTQIAFSLHNETESLPPRVEFNTALYGDSLKIFSDTFLCYGAKEFRNILQASLVKENGYSGTVTHPCLPKGYEINATYDEIFSSPCTSDYRSPARQNPNVTIVGSSNNTGCAAEVDKLYNLSNCSWNACSFDGHPLAEIPDNLLAKGALYYTVKDLKVLKDGIVNKTEFETAMKAFCSSDLDKIEDPDIKYPLSVCATAHHVYALLNRGYKLEAAEWADIIFTNEIRGTDMGWTLGFMINATVSLDSVPKLTMFSISKVTLGLILAVSIALILVGLTSLFCSCMQKKRHTQNQFLTGAH